MWTTRARASRRAPAAAAIPAHEQVGLQRLADPVDHISRKLLIMIAIATIIES
jgi:hypothetical protein